jgi:hypothetical protein
MAAAAGRACCAAAPSQTQPADEQAGNRAGDCAGFAGQADPAGPRQEHQQGKSVGVQRAAPKGALGQRQSAPADPPHAAVRIRHPKVRGSGCRTGCRHVATAQPPVHGSDRNRPRPCVSSPPVVHATIVPHASVISRRASYALSPVAGHRRRRAGCSLHGTTDDRPRYRAGAAASRLPLHAPGKSANARCRSDNSSPRQFPHNSSLRSPAERSLAQFLRQGIHGRIDRFTDLPGSAAGSPGC